MDHPSSIIRSSPRKRYGMHTSLDAGRMVRGVKMSATWFPSTLWERDRERGGDKALRARLLPIVKRRTAGGRDLSDRGYEPKAALLYPSPCPSPTRGEGTLWHCSAHLPATHPRAAPKCVHALARKRGPRATNAAPSTWLLGPRLRGDERNFRSRP